MFFSLPACLLLLSLLVSICSFLISKLASNDAAAAKYCLHQIIPQCKVEIQLLSVLTTFQFSEFNIFVMK